MPRGAAVTAVTAVAAVATVATLAVGAGTTYTRTSVQWDQTGVRIDVLGWSADGGTLLFTREVDYFPMETIDDADHRPMRMVLGVARDARTGLERRWVLSLTGDDGRPVQRDELAGYGDAEAWRVMVADVAPVNARGERSPDGRAVARVSGARTSCRWRGGGHACALRAEGEAGASEVAVRLETDVEGRRVSGIVLYEEDPPVVAEVSAHWSPDGRRMAWLVRREQAAAGAGARDRQFLTVVPLGPRVQVLAARSLRPRLPEVMRAVEATGAIPTSARVSPEEWTETAVYAAPGFEAEAARLAGALPGGATVLPLLGRSSFDLVVAVPVAMLPAPSATDPIATAPVVAPPAVAGVGVVPPLPDLEAGARRERQAALRRLVGGLAAVTLLAAAWGVVALRRRRRRGGAGGGPTPS